MLKLFNPLTNKDEKGFNLLEVIIALAAFGMLSLAFLRTMSTTSSMQENQVVVLKADKLGLAIQKNADEIIKTIKTY